VDHEVGILGLGRIGSAIAARLVGFGCAIAYHNRREVAGSPSGLRARDEMTILRGGGGHGRFQ